MPVYTIQTSDGKTHKVEAADVAGLDDFVADYDRSNKLSGAIQQPGQVPDSGVEAPLRREEAENHLGNWLDVATPVGSLKTLYRVARHLSAKGEAMPSGPEIGAAVLDIGTLGASPFVRSAGPLAKMAGRAGLEQALAQGMAGGTASYAAGAAGAPLPVQLAAGLGGGIAAGRVAMPNASVARRVPIGEEAAALARTARGMGLGVAAPTGTSFREVNAPFMAARRALGSQYEALEPELFKTSKTTPEVLQRVQQAGEKALSKEVPASVVRPIDPKLAANPIAARAALRRLESLENIPASGTPEQTMKTLRGIIQGTKKEYAAGLKPKAPVNLASGGMGEMADAMDEAFRGLAPEEAVQRLGAIDSAYAKLAKLHDIAFRASRGNVGRVPAEFNPRKAVELWKATKAEELASKFSPSEIAAMDFLTRQTKPGAAAKLLEGVANWGVEKLKGLGLKGLSFHPPARFTEAAKPSIIKEARQAAYPLGRQVGLEERRKEARLKNEKLRAAAAAY